MLWFEAEDQFTPKIKSICAETYVIESSLHTLEIFTKCC